MKSVFAMLLSVVQAIAVFAGDASLSDDLLTITPMDLQRHMYAEFTNGYSSSFLKVEVGELTLVRGDIRTPLVFQIRSGGSGLCGNRRDIADSQSDEFITQHFVPRKGDVVTLYRAATVQTLRDLPVTTDEVPSPSFGPFPNNRQSAVGDVTDTTIVVVRLERLADTSDYVDIDSVITYPNTKSVFVAHEGTDPELYEHKRSIPERFFGDSVRFRIVARRLGTSTSEFSSSQAIAIPAYSAWRCPWAMSKLPTSEFDTLYARQAALKNAYTQLCKQFRSQSVVDRNRPELRDTFAMSTVHGYLDAGCIEISVIAPQPIRELTWYVYDVKGTLLNSGLIWPRIQRYGWVYVPYLPLSHDVYIVKLEDNSTGYTDQREIRQQFATSR